MKIPLTRVVIPRGSRDSGGMTNTKTPANPRPAELLIGTCPICSTPRSAFARSSRGLECGSCGFLSTHRDVVLVTGSPLKVVR